MVLKNICKALAITSLWCSLSGGASAQTLPQPTINLVGTITGACTLNNAAACHPEGVSYYSLFRRFLGLSESELIAKVQYLFYEPPPYTRHKKVQSFDLLQFRFSSKTRFGKGLYIISNNKNVGYCLMSNDKFFSNKPGYSQIKTSLVSTPNYAKQHLLYPQLVQFYERDHGAYVERYALAKNSYKEMLLIDAFYPRILENHMQKTIAKNINYMLRMEAKRKNLILPPPHPQSDPYQDFDQDNGD